MDKGATTSGSAEYRTPPTEYRENGRAAMGEAGFEVTARRGVVVG